MGTCETTKWGQTYAFLIQEMGNQTNGSTQDEETVQNTHAEVILSLLWRERATVAEKVYKADGNTAVHVQDQVVLLGGGDSLDGDGIVEELVGSEVLHDELFDKLNTEIGVVSRLDSVTDTRDCQRLESRSCSLFDDNLLSLFSFLMVSTNSLGDQPLSNALVNSSAAPSRAPPNREPMVKRPATSEDIKSLPARVVMIVFMAPDTAGP